MFRSFFIKTTCANHKGSRDREICTIGKILIGWLGPTHLLVAHFRHEPHHFLYQIKINQSTTSYSRRNGNWWQQAKKTTQRTFEGRVSNIAMQTAKQSLYILVIIIITKHRLAYVDGRKGRLLMGKLRACAAQLGGKKWQLQIWIYHHNHHDLLYWSSFIINISNDHHQL